MGGPTASMSTDTPPGSLPLYSPSAASPDYAAEPASDERRLQHAARPRAAPPIYQGTFTKKKGNITVSLHEQETDAEIPIYRNNAIVKGELQVQEDDVSSVAIQLEGRQSLYTDESGTNSFELFAHVYDLWKKQDGTSLPTSLSFQIPFPMHFTDQHGSHLVPPSYGLRTPGALNLRGGNWYQIVVIVTKKRFASWEKQKKLELRIRYRPISYPSAPIPAVPRASLSVATSAPADWHQVVSTIVPQDPTWDPVDCILYIPSVQTYALADTIPFCLQLKGSTKSLWKLLGIAALASATSPQMSSSSPPPDSSTDSTSTSQKVATAIRNSTSLLKNFSYGKSDDKPRLLRVYLQRQLTAQLDGQTVGKETMLAEAKLSTPSNSSTDADSAAFGWEGEIQILPGTTVVASFHAKALRLKDNIVVHVVPDNHEKSPYPEHRHVHPIRLVTNSYEASSNHPADTLNS